MTDSVFYDELADSWWDQDGFLHGIGTLLNPVRVPYIERVLRDIAGGPGDRRALDIGCGGGLFAEPLSALGMAVTGVDASVRSLVAGRDHGDVVEYVGAIADRLPFADGTFDIAVAMEILEHVEDPGSVVVEAARVLRPGGIFFFAGPSRTRLSRLVLIDFAQRWRWSAVLPRDLHRWESFITPSEMSSMLGNSGIVTQETIGLGLEWGGLPAAMRAYRLLRRGRIGHGEAGRRVRLTSQRSTKIAYMGYGIKD